MRKYIRIGVDIAKNCFQVHALESEDCSATKRRLSRSGIVKFLAEVEPCAIGMEACGSAHYWARRFRAMGHEVKLTPPIYAADAAAICEAMSRPNMRFVAVKSEDQQAGHSGTVGRTGQGDPLLPFEVGLVKGREAPESGLRLKAQRANRRSRRWPVCRCPSISPLTSLLCSTGRG
jgi:transposase